MTGPQLFSLLVGVALCVVALIAFVGQRTRRFKALFWMAIGLTLVYAGFRPHFIEYFGEDTTELRLRLVVVLLSFIVLTITLETIRVGRMLERYAFLWLITGSLLLFGALFEELALIIPKWTGISFVATVLLVLFAFVLLLLFYLSVALSTAQNKLFQVSRALALTEERVRRLEQPQRGPCARPNQHPKPAGGDL